MTDLGPVEFQLEMQSTVRHVLMTFVNGFLAVRGHCLGS